MVTGAFLNKRVTKLRYDWKKLGAQCQVCIAFKIDTNISCFCQRRSV